VASAEDGVAFQETTQLCGGGEPHGGGTDRDLVLGIQPNMLVIPAPATRTTWPTTSPPARCGCPATNWPASTPCTGRAPDRVGAAGPPRGAVRSRAGHGRPRPEPRLPPPLPDPRPAPFLRTRCGDPADDVSLTGRAGPPRGRPRRAPPRSLAR
jgi:hypothetical protein